MPNPVNLSSDYTSDKTCAICSGPVDLTAAFRIGDDHAKTGRQFRPFLARLNIERATSGPDSTAKHQQPTHELQSHIRLPLAPLPNLIYSTRLFQVGI